MESKTVSSLSNNIFKLEQVLAKAAESSPEDYLTYCANLTGIAESETLEDRLSRNGVSDVTELAPYCGIWPSDTPTVWGDVGTRFVHAFQEPGAYIDAYEIVAVNVAACKMWGILIDDIDQLQLQLKLPQHQVDAIALAAAECYRSGQVIWAERWRLLQGDSAEEEL